jgi:hypothetical protein
VAAFVVELTSGYQHTWAKALCLTGCAGFFIVTFVWVSVVIMAGIMRWKNDSSI